MHDSGSLRMRHYRATPEDAATLRSLLEAAIDAGELPDIAPHDIAFILDQSTTTPTGTLLALDGVDDRVVGFYQVAWPLLYVTPGARRRGHGRALVLQALAEAERPEAVELSPPVGNAAAEAFADALGFTYLTSFWRLRLPAECAVPTPVLPSGYTLRHFQPGTDDDGYMHVVNTAFAGHHPPIVLTPASLARAHARPTFAPSNIAVVLPDAAPEVITAFCRVNEKPDGTAEVYLLGVLPEARGHGLGRELLRWGVMTLRARGHDEVLLTVEGRNANALTLYTSHGFQHHAEWPRWTWTQTRT